MPNIPATILESLQAQPPFRHLWVAFSGGIDSHVLLHSLAQLRSQLRGADLSAIHVNHGLMPQAKQWAEHCRQVATALSVDCHIVNVDARAHVGESPEAKARQVRYQAFYSMMQKNDALLTAHHQDDQAETLMLQLLRGSGPRGLAAMPECSVKPGKTILRPLLSLSQADIESYAKQHQLQWIDDSSNEDCGYDRNYLRHQVIPLIKQRWPSMAKTISRSAQLCADAAHSLDEQAEADLDKVAVEQGLSVFALNKLSMHRLNNVLRHWIRQTGLPIPNQSVLQQVVSLLQASNDAKPLVHWKGAELRRYRDTVYIMAPLSTLPNSNPYPWQWDQELQIQGLGTLRAVADRGRGVRQDCGGYLTVGFRRGGERYRQGNHHHSLKKLFQEKGILPWLRDRIPLIYLEEELVAVGDFFVTDHYMAIGEQPGWRLQWVPSTVSC